jgi:lipopolysaccharide/colanic/teichoic acid biosynthesis glycosyltransferase
MQESIARLRPYSGRSALEDCSGLERWKSAIDLAVAALALLVLMPIMFMTAVLIRLSTEGPIILCERLIGRGGRTFVGYKFCVAAANAEGASPWAQRVAEALRKSSLDQLPRLFNVIRGDMSLIGPRPRAAAELGIYFAQAPECLLARPGLISLWPTCNRPFREHRTEIALDRYYVSNWSMGLDLVLLSKTILAIQRDDRTA